MLAQTEMLKLLQICDPTDKNMNVVTSSNIATPTTGWSTVGGDKFDAPRVLSALNDARLLVFALYKAKADSQGKSVIDLTTLNPTNTPVTFSAIVSGVATLPLTGFSIYDESAFILTATLGSVNAQIDLMKNMDYVLVKRLNAPADIGVSIAKATVYIKTIPSVGTARYLTGSASWTGATQILTATMNTGFAATDVGNQVFFNNGAAVYYGVISQVYATGACGVGLPGVLPGGDIASLSYVMMEGAVTTINSPVIEIYTGAPTITNAQLLYFGVNNYSMTDITNGTTIGTYGDDDVDNYVIPAAVKLLAGQGAEQIMQELSKKMAA